MGCAIFVALLIVLPSLVDRELEADPEAVSEDEVDIDVDGGLLAGTDAPSQRIGGRTKAANQQDISRAIQYPPSESSSQLHVFSMLRDS